MIGTHEEPLDNKADAAPKEEDPKGAEAVEKRQAEAKDLEGRPEIKDNAGDASKKLSADSSKAAGEQLPKGLEAQDSAEVIKKAATEKAALAKMSK